MDPHVAFSVSCPWLWSSVTQVSDCTHGSPAGQRCGKPLGVAFGYQYQTSQPTCDHCRFRSLHGTDQCCVGNCGIVSVEQEAGQRGHLPCFTTINTCRSHVCDTPSTRNTHRCSTNGDTRTHISACYRITTLTCERNDPVCCCQCRTEP